MALIEVWRNHLHRRRSKGANDEDDQHMVYEDAVKDTHQELRKQPTGALTSCPFMCAEASCLAGAVRLELKPSGNYLFRL